MILQESPILCIRRMLKEFEGSLVLRSMMGHQSVKRQPPVEIFNKHLSDVVTAKIIFFKFTTAGGLAVFFHSIEHS